MRPLSARRWQRGDTLGPALRAKAIEQVGHMHAWLEAQLDGRDWLNGEGFRWGDLAAVPYVTMSSMFGIDPDPDSALGRWLERAWARPSVARTVEEALATKSWSTGLLTTPFASPTQRASQPLIPQPPPTEDVTASRRRADAGTAERRRRGSP
ncbi:MAG: hypothetical protein JOY63_15285 [Acetobacteraceae bacterium]|nr:hypothetical protein [Acetobacteraceae bacterium]